MIKTREQLYIFPEEMILKVDSPTPTSWGANTADLTSAFRQLGMDYGITQFWWHRSQNESHRVDQCANFAEPHTGVYNNEC